MANQFVDFVKQIVALTRDVQQGKENVKELREDLKVANQKIDRLMEAFQRLTFEFQRDRENAVSEREMQRLRLENIVLRSERSLLPASPQPDHDKDVLREQMEALRRENEEPRKRLERLEQEKE